MFVSMPLRLSFLQVKSYCGHGIGELFHCAPNIPHYSSMFLATISYLYFLYYSAVNTYWSSYVIRVHSVIELEVCWPYLMQETRLLVS